MPDLPYLGIVPVVPPVPARLKRDWVRQYFLLEGVRWTAGGHPGEHTLAYGIISLGKEANSAWLLAMGSGHWEIENCSDWVQDTLLGENESRSSKKNIAQVLGSLRCVHLMLLHGQHRFAGGCGSASLRQRFEQHPSEILTLLEPLG